MNATQLYDFANMGKAKLSSFVPALTTGTQPLSQGSAVSVALPETTVVAKQAVPTPYGLPFTTIQNQGYPDTTDATPPWVSVPACLAGKPKPQLRGLGLITPGIHTLNLPVPKNVPQQRIHAWTY
jgi:hypothetical protein